MVDRPRDRPIVAAYAGSMARDQHADRDAVRITTASASRERRHRGAAAPLHHLDGASGRVCFVGAIVVGDGWLRWVLIVAAVLLPYVAVVMANADDLRNPTGSTLLDGASGYRELDRDGSDIRRHDRPPGHLTSTVAVEESRGRAEPPPSQFAVRCRTASPVVVRHRLPFRRRDRVPTRCRSDPMTDHRAEPICSAKGCTAPAVWALLWNNPKLHTPDRRKTWLACDEHRQSLSRLPGRARLPEGRRPGVRADRVAAGSAADGGHRPVGLEERRVVDAVAGALAAHRDDPALGELLVGGAGAQRRRAGRTPRGRTGSCGPGRRR